MSGVRGAGRVRRLLKRLPEAMRDEIAKAMKAAAPTILGRAKSETPRKSGLLASLLSSKFFDNSLRLRVGLLGKRANSRAFYGRILEAGRKAQTVRVRRRTSGGVISYALRVRAMSPGRYDIVRGRTAALAKRILRPVLVRIYDRALARAAAGGGE